MFFQRVKTKGLGHNAYLLGCGEGLAVDRRPAPRRRRIPDAGAREQPERSRTCCETHRQEDFEFGSRALADATGAKIVTGTHNCSASRT